MKKLFEICKKVIVNEEKINLVNKTVMNAGAELALAKNGVYDAAWKEEQKDYISKVFHAILRDLNNTANRLEETYQRWYLNNEEEWDVEYPENADKNEAIFAPIRKEVLRLIEEIATRQQKHHEGFIEKYANGLKELEDKCDTALAQQKLAFKSYEEARKEMWDAINADSVLRKRLGMIKALFAEVTGQEATLDIVPYLDGDNVHLNIVIEYNEKCTQDIEKDELDIKGARVISDLTDLIERNIEYFEGDLQESVDNFEKMVYTVSDAEVSGDTTLVRIPEERDVGIEGWEGKVFSGPVTAYATATITITLKI